VDEGLPPESLSGRKQVGSDLNLQQDINNIFNVLLNSTALKISPSGSSNQYNQVVPVGKFFLGPVTVSEQQITRK